MWIVNAIGVIWHIASHSLSALFAKLSSVYTSSTCTIWTELPLLYHCYVSTMQCILLICMLFPAVRCEVLLKHGTAEMFGLQSPEHLRYVECSRSMLGSGVRYKHIGSSQPGHIFCHNLTYVRPGQNHIDCDCTIVDSDSSRASWKGGQYWECIFGDID